MVGWHHWLDGHEFEQALGVDDGQGSLVCCSPWGHKELDMTERLNWTELLKKFIRLHWILVGTHNIFSCGMGTLSWVCGIYVPWPGIESRPLELGAQSVSPWRRQWHPTPVFLSGKSHGRRSLVGCSHSPTLWVRHDWATSLSLFTFMH